MLSNTISARVLQLGLQQYLKKYQYSNANDVQLWAEITEVNAYEINQLGGFLFGEISTNPYNYNPFNA